MNDREREHLSLVAQHALELARTAIDRKIEAVFADHASKGRLHSGATIQVTVRIMGEVTEAFTGELAGKALAISRDNEAFGIFSGAVKQCLEICAEQMLRIVKMAAGRQTPTRNDSIDRAANKLFAEMRSSIEAKVAIARFEFHAGGSDPAAHPPVIGATIKKGGRPPAEFWDDMWAEIASTLYDGSLIPKTQADIERAMTAWIEENGYTAAVSTVRARARRLWDRLAAGK